jgi:EAL domain-containing protein (putative c-di-GMP-specific phosphodiesterase class I)
LLRLRDDQGGLVPPGVFIPAAERYNLMTALDRWVVRAACRYIRGQLDSGEGRWSGYFINLSGTSLSDESFFRHIREQVDAFQIPPGLLCFEITETAAIANIAQATKFIREVREIGCKFALDDFGSGLSSFSYLRAIPVDFLKIDGSFVCNMLNDPLDRGIVEACHHVGHVAGLKTIAEFVESMDIFEALKEIGVDYAQGYGIAKPQPL